MVDLSIAMLNYQRPEGITSWKHGHLSLGGATKNNVKLGNLQQCTAIGTAKMAMNIWIDHVFGRLPRNVPAMVFQLRTCWPPHHVLAGHLCVEPRDTWYGPKMESQPI